MLSRRPLILLAAVAFVPVVVVACASKGDFQGGGRSLEPGIIPSTTDDTGTPPPDTGVDSGQPDTFVATDTGAKDSGNQ